MKNNKKITFMLDDHSEVWMIKNIPPSLWDFTRKCFDIPISIDKKLVKK